MMKTGFRTTFNSPAMTMPKRIYTDESSRILQDALKMVKNISITLFLPDMRETDVGQHFHMIINQTVVEHRPFSPVFDKIDVA